MKKKTLFWLLPLVAATALGLSACGGGGNDNQSNAGGSGTGDAVDSFFAQVAAIIATTSDSTEPVSTDAITATSPEATEPQPII
jgi:hypothetical protein